EYFVRRRCQSKCRACIVLTSSAGADLTMTLGNMREHGVHSLAVYCGALWCHHQAVLDVSAFADDVAVPAFGPRMVCTVCGAIGAEARPNWNERAPRSLFGRNS